MENLSQNFNKKVNKYGNKFYDGLGDFLTTDVTPKGLVGILGAGIIVLGIGGCASTRTYQKGQVHGYNFENQTQDSSPYKEERIILHGQEFYIQKRETKNPTELSFEFLPFDKVSRVIDLDTNIPNKRVKLESEEYYIPKKAESPGTINNYVDILILDKNDWPKYKIKGIKSNVRKTDVNSLCQTQFNGSSVIKTEQNADYGIRKATILGKEYFFPHVEKNKTNKKKLNFYLVPVKGAKIRIKNKTGEVSIENDDKVYRPQMPVITPLPTLKISPLPKNQSPTSVTRQKSK